MRSVCTILFVFLCGCIYHLAIQTNDVVNGISVFPYLYQSGIEGRSGGVLCGGMAMLLRGAMGNVISYILIGISAILTLLGALEITVPSLIRAIINRPRDDWEDEEQTEVYVEPAAAVVNHIANKQIENKRKRRQQQLQREQLRQQEAAQKAEAAPAPESTALSEQPVAKPTPAKRQQPTEQADTERESGAKPTNAARMMSTIDLDIESPLFGGQSAYAAPATPISPVRVEAGDEFEDIPEEDEIAEQMPMEEYIPAPPVKKAPPVQKAAAKAQSDTAEPEVKPGKVSEKEAQESAKQVAMEIQQNSGAPVAE